MFQESPRRGRRANRHSDAAEPIDATLQNLSGASAAEPAVPPREPTEPVDRPSAGSDSGSPQRGTVQVQAASVPTAEWVSPLPSQPTYLQLLRQSNPHGDDPLLGLPTRWRQTPDTTSTDASGPSATPAFPTHTTVGSDLATPDYYHTGVLLGKGGMGEVYAVEQVALEREVAFKVIQRGRQDVHGFLREARIAAFLDHPNIVPVHELGKTQDGDPFYSMKKVEGEDWSRILKADSSPGQGVAEARLESHLQWFLSVCDAIAFAHDRGVIHRDLKPGNIRIGKFGEVIVMDWGLALRIGQRDGGASGGTPHYAAPEMYFGDLARIDCRTDIYLLGAILFHIRTGQPPHPNGPESDWREPVRQNRFGDPKHPLMLIALTALKYDPFERYQTVSDLQEAIRTYLQHRDSLRIADRSEEKLRQAEKLAASKSQNAYEYFQQAIFGYAEAIDRWEGNRQAYDGLMRAKLAYAEFAFQNEQFDVVLKIADSEHPDNAKLRSIKGNAAKGLKRKKLRDRLFWGLLVTFVIALGAAYVIQNDNAKRLTREKEIADEATWQQKRATALATDNEKLAKIQGKKSEQLREKEAEARDMENKARLAAQEAFRKQRELTITAEEAEKRARQQRERSDLVGYGSAVSAAAVRFQVGDLEIGRRLLEDVKQLSQRSPEFDNWGVRRQAFLANLDLDLQHALPRLKVTEQVSATATAPAASRLAIAGKANGGENVSLHVVTLLDREPWWEQTELDLPATDLLRPEVFACVLSHDGKMLAAALDAVREPAGQASRHLFLWRLDEPQTPPVRLDQLADKEFPLGWLSDDLVIGSPGGLRLWKKDDWERGTTSSEKPRQFFGGRHAKAMLPLSNDESILLLKGGGDAAWYCVRLTRELFDSTSKPAVVVDSLQDLPVTLSAERPKVRTVGSDHLLFGGSDGRIALWSITDKKFMPVDGQRDSNETQMLAATTAADTTDWLIISGAVPFVQVWRRDKQDWDEQMRLLGHESAILDGMVLKGDRAVTLDKDGFILLWQLERLRERHRLTIADRQQSILAIGTDRQGRTAMAIDSRGTVIGRRLVDWGVAPGSPASNRWLDFVGHSYGFEMKASSLTADGRLFATVAVGKTANDDYKYQVCLWDLFEGRMLWRIEEPSDRYVSPTLCVSTDSDAEKFWLAVGFDNGPGWVVDIAKRKLKQLDPKAQQLIRRPMHPDMVTCVRANGVFDLWHVREGKKISEGTRESSFSGELYRSVWSPDGETLAILHRSKENKLGIHLHHQSNFGMFKPIDLPDDIDGRPKNCDFIIGRTDQAMKWNLHLVQRSDDRKSGKTDCYTYEIAWDDPPRRLEGEPKETREGWHWCRLAANTGEILHIDDSQLLSALGDDATAVGRLHAAEDSPYLVAVDSKGGATLVECDADGQPSQAVHRLRWATCTAADVAAHSGRGWRGVMAHRKEVWLVQPAREDGQSREWWAIPSKELSRIDEVHLSSNAEYVALVGVGADGQRKVDCFGLEDVSSLSKAKSTRLPLIEEVAWHPDPDSGGHRMLARHQHDGPIIVDFDGHQPPRPSLFPLLQRQLDSSRIDWIGWFHARLSDRVQPLTHQKVGRWPNEPIGNRSDSGDWYPLLQLSNDERLERQVIRPASMSLGFFQSGSQLTCFMPLTVHEPQLLACSENKMKGMASENKMVGMATAEKRLIARVFEGGGIGLAYVPDAIGGDSNPIDLFAIDDHRGAKKVRVRFSPEGKHLLSADERGRAYVWMSDD